jgi:hypothetical protein
MDTVAVERRVVVVWWGGTTLEGLLRELLDRVLSKVEAGARTQVGT